MAAAPTITVQTLLREMADLNRLTWPLPYSHAQASSYDRASNPGPHQDWFANGDSGNFVRIEHVEGRTEYVLADLKGPGVVDRFWSANPCGVVRFYFDGETSARFTANLQQLLTGKYPHIGFPFAYDASHGENMYFPIPYAKSLKITVDDSLKEKPTSLYYHVGFRTYPAGTSVESFDPSVLPTLDDEMGQVAKQLTSGWSRNCDWARIRRVQASPHERVTALSLAGSGVIRRFMIQIPFPLSRKTAPTSWSDPAASQNVLRNLLLTIAADGKTCVSAPLGDFFGSAPGLNPYKTLGASMQSDGAMTCYLPMPYASGLTVTIENVGSVSAPMIVEANGDFAKQAPPFRLHAQWTVLQEHSRPFKDMNLLTTSGPGNWVGCNLSVANPSSAWWGEGDEKVYVDGEQFPSTFGTGTEDFFGYAWGSPDPYQRPYHAQTRADGPGSFGHASELRWQFLDAIPYKTGLRFDLERWHWADVIATYARTAYWYAPASAPGPVAINRALLAPPEMAVPKVKGALEGEDLKITDMSGGHTDIQGGFGEISGGKQLWWLDPGIGDRLALDVPVKEAGTYEVFGNFCHAADYGTMLLRFNGQDCQTIDFYETGLEWKLQSFGVFTLPKGTVKFEAICKGQNRSALPRRMFGLDYLLLKKM